MELKIAYQTKSKCYNRASKITPKGILIHSTGANNPNIKRYVDAADILGENTNGNHWNKATATKALHGWVGYDKDKNVIAVQTLPYSIACWGCGSGKWRTELKNPLPNNGSYNYDASAKYPKQKAHIQFEICESSSTDRAYYEKAIKVAEEYCIYLCKLYGFSVNDITTHKEAASGGFASNHGDPQSYMKNFGDSIEKFRARVAAALGEEIQVNKGLTGWYCEVNTSKDIGLSLWTSTSTSTRIRLIRVPKGEEVYVVEDDLSGWAKATYQGEEGYVDTQYLVAKRQATEEVEEQDETDEIPDESAQDTELEEKIDKLLSLMEEVKILLGSEK